MKLNTYFKIIFSFSISVFLLLFSIKVAVNFKYIYYFDIKHLNIENYTSLSNKEIRSTYDYLINYVDSSSNAAFNIPTLKSSEEGKVHFLEVKNIFRRLNSILLISTIISAVGILYIYKYKCFSILNLASNLLLSVCALTIIPCCINFNKSFNLFHEAIFKNNYWLFDPEKDPVINILPEEYFFHCAVLIISIIIVGSLILKLIYVRNVKNRK
ncbi:TIGR01906 family membrane protein [Clostridium sp. P21]|uniref:TIGR01906 family membrane protein n=1 Tax=Clostridium muellerianum TaxID=2716538 RepID=A0A7Y0HRQ2_9CLOT|nr:TIGR01906 family membrane protein [Clostridium muellerianum]NMM65446.1 TIGR01906 family membrane protein [Clostridium muellerianum]